MSARISASLFGAALALTAMATAAETDVRTANFILPGCQYSIAQPNRGFFIQGFCTGIVFGIAYMGSSVRAAQEVTSSRNVAPQAFIRQQLCLDVPDEVTKAQLVRIVTSYIETRPERMHEDFRALTIEALRTAWPCK